MTNIPFTLRIIAQAAREVAEEGGVSSGALNDLALGLDLKATELEELFATIQQHAESTNE